MQGAARRGAPAARVSLLILARQRLTWAMRPGGADVRHTTEPWRHTRPCSPSALKRTWLCAGLAQGSAKMDTSDLQGVAYKAFSFGKQLVKQGCVRSRIRA